MRPTRIPLFPLNAVLLPGASMPLHIFEPRYRLMTSHCITHKLEFGVILAGGKGVATIGCTAQILQTIKTHSGGESDILTEGRAVFRAVELLSEKDYHEAIVEYVPDTPEQPESSTEDALMGSFQQCHSLLYHQLWSPAPRDAHWPISYRMAARLPLALEEKQALLEIREEPKRQEFLAGWLGRLLPELEIRERGRVRASTNGHSVH